MKVYQGIRHLKEKLTGAVVTIGNFDGVHLGHQALVKRVLEKSNQIRVKSVVMIFDPHPITFLYPERHFQRVFPISDLIVSMENLGVDVLVVEPFSRELSELDPEAFVREYIVKPFSAREVVIGYDFAFGKSRQGTSEFLKSKGRDFGFEVEVFSPVNVAGVVVSSSEIRKNILLGNMKTVNLLLGRYFYLEGIVEKGVGRGRTLGIPTANLSPICDIFPKYGVYITDVELEGKKYKAVTNIGVNPTFVEKNVGHPKIETHILDYSGDIYGRRIRIEFKEFLRDEKKFSNQMELVKQIGLDINLSKKWFEREGGNDI
ncbi:MAG: bifunctional riboflavin kinase/FAD synthetase [Pseudomonadota bacterium]|nr:bifunctional riboflavin kinase/FAD synthetase [Pseudomonadota bacterium]